MPLHFDFLFQPAGYDILFSLIDYSPQDTHLKAFFVGVLNTLFLGLLSIISSTFFGFVLGSFRVSQNFLVRNIARVIINVFRNIPIIIHIILWYAVLNTLPQVRESWVLDELFLSTIKGSLFPLQTTKSLLFIYCYLLYLLFSVH